MNYKVKGDYKMSYKIEKSTIDSALYSFLKSTYLFQKRELALFGINWNEVYLLQLLLLHPGIQVTKLSEKMDNKKFVTSRMISRLEDDGLVIKNSLQSDKRIVNVYITDKGRETIANIEAYNYKIISSQFDKIPETTMRLILDSISKLDEFLDLDNQLTRKDEHDESN